MFEGCRKSVFKCLEAFRVTLVRRFYNQCELSIGGFPPKKTYQEMTKRINRVDKFCRWLFGYLQIILD